jgi:hypothetical protein
LFTFLLLVLFAQISQAALMVEKVGISSGEIDCSRQPRTKALTENIMPNVPGHFLSFSTVDVTGEKIEISWTLKTPSEIIVTSENQNVRLILKDGEFDLGQVVTEKVVDEFCDKNLDKKFNTHMARVEPSPPLSIDSTIIKKGCEKHYGVIPILDRTTYEWFVDYLVTLKNEKGQIITFKNRKSILGYTTQSACLANDK